MRLTYFFFDFLEVGGYVGSLYWTLCSLSALVALQRFSG
jgi:hypothetical protein